MAVNKRLLQGAAAAPGGITPSEHFGVVLYEGDGSSSHSINGGKFGAGGYFNGSNGYVDLSTSVITQENFSFSLWFYPTVNYTSTVNYVFAHQASTGSRGITFGFSAGNWRAKVSNGSNVSIVTMSSPTLNAWTHIAVTYSTTNGLELFVNGVSQGTDTYTALDISNHTGCKLGSRGYSAGDYFDGKIDQVRIFTKALTSSQVSTLYAETVETVESLDPLSEDTTDTLQVLGDSSCVATYRFENDETDLSGNYDGTGTAIQYAAGRYGQAASFNGSSSSVSVTTTSTTPVDFSARSYSLSLWVNTTSTTLSSLLSKYGDSDAARSFTLLLQANGTIRYVERATGTSTQTDSTGTINDDNWHHIVVTKSSTATTIYIDGSLDIQNSNTFTSNNGGTEPFRIGRDNTGSPEWFKGKIDQVRVFNKEISASEVTTLYNENSLVASYRFEGNANDDTRNYDGTATNVTYEYGLNFTPDFVWLKERSGVDSHRVFDTTRGATKRIYTDNTGAESTATDSLTSFDTNGFSLGSSAAVNQSGEDYVAWCLKANGGTTSSNTDGNITSTVQVNEQAGFSIIQYTSPSSPSSSTDRVGHGLGTTPAMVIVKRTDGVEDWYIWHKELGGGGSGALNKYLRFNTNAQATASNLFNTVNSTVVNLSYTGTGNLQNIAYAFAEVENFSSFGSYTGNGSTDGPIIETGFEPAFLMVKRTSNTADWIILDNKRNLTNPKDKYLFANSSAAEGTSTRANFLSNGFQVITTGANMNFNGDNYIYMAFAADPDTEAPTVAKSFSTVTYTGNGSTQTIDGLGFTPNLVWIKNRDDGIRPHNLHDSVRGVDKVVYSNLTNAEATVASVSSFDSNGFTLGSGGADTNGSGDNYVAWAWKADDNEPTIYGGPALAVYKFEDNVNDVTGDYNATASNVTYSSSGKFNKAASFNGTSGKVEIDALDSFFNQKQTFSVSLWFKTTESSNNGVLFSDYANTSININATVVGSTGAASISTRYSGNTASFSSTETGLNDGNWHHFVYTSDKVTGKMYINGSLSNTVTLSTSGWNGDSNLIPMIGAKYEPQSSVYNGFFNGQIDQVRIYQGAIAQEQVDELYAETTSDNDDLTLGAPPKSIVSANANAGFSIVKWEGNGNAGKIPHGLSAVPEMIITKRLTGTSPWYTYNAYLNGGTNPAHYFVNLNTTAAETSNGSSGGSLFNSTPPTSTIFNIGTSLSGSGDDYIAYCFHSVAGYSKFGSYSGNGTTQTITTGFQPDFVMIKAYTNSTSLTSWTIIDSVRYGSSSDTNPIYANLSAAEGTRGNGSGDGDVLEISFTATGFKLGDTGSDNGSDEMNDPNNDYIYMAFKIN